MDSNDNIFTTSSSSNSYLEIGNINPEAKETNDIFSSYDTVDFAEDTNFKSYMIKAINLQKEYFIGNYKYNNRVVDSNTGEVLNTWKEDIKRPIFSPNSEYIAFLYSDVNSGGPYRVGYYDYANNQFQLLHYETRPSSFAFTNDSTKLLSIENEATQDGVDKIIAYTLGTEEVTAETVAEFDYQDYPEMGRLSSLAISPADDIILVGTDKGNILAYDMQNSTLLHQWQAHENGSVMAVAFSRDGKTIYTSNEYGEIKVWGSKPLDWD
jgi:WD40 repeat protein